MRRDEKDILADRFLPHCLVFQCVKNKARTICCYYCPDKAKCTWPCRNDPKKCAQVNPLTMIERNEQDAEKETR